MERDRHKQRVKQPQQHKKLILEKKWKTETNPKQIKATRTKQTTSTAEQINNLVEKLRNFID